MRIVACMRSLLRFRHVLVLGVLLVLVAAAAPADAQTLLLTLDSPNPQANANFGSAIAVGDVNGDGKADIAVGAPAENVAGNNSQGRAYVFSGAAGALLFTLDTPDPQANAIFGSTTAVGDANGDGKADIAVGASTERVGSFDGQGRAYVFSGATGALLFTLDTPNPQANANFGGGVAVAMGDVNGDGKADIAVGAPGESVAGNAGQGREYIFSGATGALLLALDNPNPQAKAYFGGSVAVGDVNGDGKADIGVGALAENVAGNAGQGRFYVFSGADGSLLLTLDTPNPQANAEFGFNAAVGDVNGDGKADIVVVALGESVAGNVAQGRAYVFSGATGALLFTLDTPNPQPITQFAFGSSVAVADVNGDGKADIAVGAPGENVASNNSQGRAYVFSGADGSLLFTVDTPNPQAIATFGFPVAIGDVNGDGKADIAIGASGESVGGKAGQGRAYVFSPASSPPAVSPTVTASTNASATPGANTTPNPQATSTPGATTAKSGGSSGPNAGLIAGIFVAVVIVAGGAGWFGYRRFRASR